MKAELLQPFRLFQLRTLKIYYSIEFTTNSTSCEYCINEINIEREKKIRFEPKPNEKNTTFIMYMYIQYVRM